MLFRLDQSRGKAFAEDVVAASVDRVEGAGVLAVEIAHAGREVRLWRLDDEVVVVAHQAASVEAPAVPARHAAKLVEEDAAIVVVQEAELLVVAARGDVVPRAGCEIATGARHASTVARSGVGRNRGEPLGTGLLQPRHVPGTSRGSSGRMGQRSVLRVSQIAPGEALRASASRSTTLRPRWPHWPRRFGQCAVPGTGRGSCGPWHFGLRAVPGTGPGLVGHVASGLPRRGRARGGDLAVRLARLDRPAYVTTPRPANARGAGATGSSRARGGECAGTAFPCALSRGNGPHHRRAPRPRSAPR
jgi:hypothetical protein